MIFSSIGLDTLHPYAHSSGPQYGIWQHMIEPLVEIDYARKDYYGVLAESWKFRGQHMEFRLRKGIRFHDGAPFTAHDVVHSVNRMRNDKRSLQKSNFDDLTEVQAPDDYTVVFTTAAPNAVMLDRLQNRFIVSKSAAEKYGDDADQYAVGTGPYKFVSWQRDGNLVMTRNDDYWGPKAAIKEIVLKKVGEDAARMAGLLAGQGDVINNVPVEEIARLEKHPRVRAEKVEGLRMYFLAMNVTHKPFDNKLVRQAFNYAVDPTAVIRHIYEGNGYVMNGPLGSQRDRLRSQDQALSARSEKGQGAFGQGRLRQRPGSQAALFAGPLSQSERGLPGDRRSTGQGRHQSRAGVAGICHLLGFGWRQRRQNSLLLRRPAGDRRRHGLRSILSLRQNQARQLSKRRSRPADRRTAQDRRSKKRVALLQQMGRILMEEAALVPLYTLAEIYGVARNVIWKAHPEEKVLASEMKIR